MLEGLDAVEWGQLTHAYGAAVDVPELIRALASNSADERREALDELFGNIWHQGTVYEATAFAVPFLIELVAEPRVEQKEVILHLLASIAEGSSYIDVHAGVIDRMGSGPRSDEQRVDREAQLSRELAWVRAAFEAVEAGVSTYLDLLANADPDVRIFAAYTLGHCQGHAAQVVMELVARFPAESDARSQAALVMAIGSLMPVVNQQGDVSTFIAERIGPEESPVVRVAAAMCLARSSAVEPPVELLEVLSVSTGLAWNDFERLPWCEGDVAGRVGEALAEYPEARLRFLLRLLDCQDEEVRSGARFALEALCHTSRSITPLAAGALAKRILAGEIADRRGSAEVLSRLGSAARLAVGPLSVALDDEDPDLRAHAAFSLAALRDLRAIPVLIALLHDDRLFPKVAKALGGFGAAASAAVPTLLDVLRRKPPREEILAHNRPIEVAVVLGQIGREARLAVPVLLSLMKKQPHIQQAAALAVGQIDGPEAGAAVSFLKKLLRSEDHLVRLSAARSLWRINRRGDEVLPVLIELIRPGAANRWRVAEALGEMGEAARQTVPALRACLEDRSMHARWMHLEAARALWRIEHRADWSLPVLAELVRDRTGGSALVSTEAAEALGEMGAAAREALPVLRAAALGDVRPFRGSIDEGVNEDEAFCAAVAEAVRRIESGA